MPRKLSALVVAALSLIITADAAGAEYSTEGGPVLLGTYHPSQQNTFTGKLTEAMMDAVIARARKLCFR